MDLRLLGPIEVRLEDGPIELGPRKQRALLAMLALQPGRTVSTDHLAEGLWGDALPPTAQKMVQLYVSRLRRVLDGNGASIVTHGHGYQLQLPEDAVDALRFEHLLETRPRDALALWHGAPLADLANEPFAAAEIRRLDELRLRATELAIDADLAAGRHAEVIAELNALVAQESLREHLHAQRMLALYRSGRQADALEAYRDARTALVEQIGVEPGAELRHLREQILAQDPELAVPAAAAPAPEHAAPRPARRSRRPLVAAVGAVWVANQLDGTVTRIDRDEGERVTIDVGGEPAGLAFGAGSLWVADGQGRAVAQIAPASSKVVQRIDVGNAAHAVAVGYGAL